MNDQAIDFSWPDNARAAVSLSFDDARETQATAGHAILNDAGVRGTFYVLMHNVDKHRDAWLAAHAAGHEIGNHTVNHPCSGNFPFSRNKALEDYTLARMADELDDASDAIAEVFGERPTSFAYPCAMTFVGRGREHQSYVPLVAERFVAGRWGFSEWHNSPTHCDPALLMSKDMDGRTVNELNAMIDHALEEGGYLNLTSHEVAPKRRQGVDPKVLEAVAKRCAESSEIYIDTVTAVTRQIITQRQAGVAT